jgi:hypothetical protein
MIENVVLMPDISKKMIENSIGRQNTELLKKVMIDSNTSRELKEDVFYRLLNASK